MNMKKILTILSVALAVLAASCTQLEKTIVSTGKSIAPVPVFSGLSASYVPATLYIDGNEVDTSLVYHFFAAVKFNDSDVNIAVASKDDQKTNKVSTTATTINSLLVSRGFENGAQVKVTFVLRAGLSANANTGCIDSEEKLEMNFVVKAASDDLKYFADYSDYTEVSKWSVIGKITSTGNDWNSDEGMKTNGVSHVCEGLELKSGDEFKFRFDGNWDVNIGAEGNDAPTVLTLGTEYPGAGGGKNLAVAEDGKYDLFVIRDSTKTEAEAKPEDYVFKVVAHYDNPYKDWTPSAEWGVIGAITSTGNNWNSDEAMISDGTWWVCRNLELKSTDEFKFRKDAAWAVNVGCTGDEATAATLATLLEGKQDGKNIKVPEDGKYDLLINPTENVYEVCVAGTVPVFE